jgi:DNA-binding transcriptional regulator YiaG
MDDQRRIACAEIERLRKECEKQQQVYAQMVCFNFWLIKNRTKS